MSDTESEFEQVDDWESVTSTSTSRGAAGPDDPPSASEEESRVVVELPAHLLLGSAQDAQQQQQQHGSADHSTETESFSFVQKMGNLKMDSSDAASSNSYTTNSSWSRVDGGDSSATASVAACSTVSGFALLTLNHSCKKCSFRYEPSDTICGGCGVALQANPCLDIDEQLARNQQLKEEKLALETLEQEEKKRKTLHQQPVFSRSQILVDQIESFVRNCGHGRLGVQVGYGTLPAPNLLVLASRFVESADTSTAEGGTKVSLAYHFSHRFEWRMDQIRQDGLGTGARVSSNMQAAYQSVGDDRSFMSGTRTARKYRMSLASIPEDGTGECTNCMGWIVATTRPSHNDFSESMVSVSTVSATVMTLKRSNLDLPLVCFDASLRNDDIIRRLLNGLSQICFDFFQSPETSILEQKQIEDMIEADQSARMTKKPRVLCPHPDSDSGSSLKSLQESFEQTAISLPSPGNEPSSLVADVTVASGSEMPAQRQQKTDVVDEEPLASMGELPQMQPQQLMQQVQRQQQQQKFSQLSDRQRSFFLQSLMKDRSASALLLPSSAPDGASTTAKATKTKKQANNNKSQQNEASSSIATGRSLAEGQKKTSGRGQKKKKTTTMKKKKKKTTIKSPHRLRPLHAYNVFFKQYREQLIAREKKNEGDSNTNPIFASLVAATPVAEIRHTTRAARRACNCGRKSHNTISFGELARAVSRRWNEMTEDEKAVYREAARVDFQRFEAEKREAAARAETAAAAAAAAATTTAAAPGGGQTDNSSTDTPLASNY